MFINREQAGKVLANKTIEYLEKLGSLSKEQILVLGLPRGGVPVAMEVAISIGCPLDVMMSKKIGAPDQPELAIGAVTADGAVVINQVLAGYLGVTKDELEAERRRLVDKIIQSEAMWRKAAHMQEAIEVRNKVVVVVDDGVATGMTAIAAARSLRNREAEKLIFATPVISQHAYDLLQREYNQIIAVDIPEDFRAVGQFYADFRQIEDNEVIDCLIKCRQAQVKQASI